jgi:hypothetical protein
MFKRNGIYYLFASHTSGWDPNPNKFFQATVCICSTFSVCGRLYTSNSQSLSGTWSAQADIAPQATRTYSSQNNFDIPLGSNAIYMGDRWRSDVLGSSTYIWFPLSFSSGSPQIVAADVWNLNITAGANLTFLRLR